MKRTYLQKNQTILLCERNNESFRRRFTIQKLISDKGSTVLCYEAVHENSGKGILKEFYPQDAIGLERDEQGNLTHSTEFMSACEAFLRNEKDFIEPYDMLLEAKRNNQGQDLATFIPAFEVYYGCDIDGNATDTLYIWTPEPKLETFDTICREIHQHPGTDPEHKLVLVLSAIETLTKCICALHTAGMVHRDIKPANFGFVNRGSETLTQALTMFDIDSICSVFSRDTMVMGTSGYMEPEAFRQRATNKTDIYSIGATLFHAIIVSDEAKDNGYLYKSDYYEQLRNMVDSSELIQASEANSHPRLRNILTLILQKCLSERSHRYDSCEELLDDLESALYYAMPSEIASRHRSGEKWVLTEAEKILDSNKEKDSFLAIQLHLYQYPLYQCVPKITDNLNVLLIGFGNYGQKFLDACLQNGQMRNKRLNVTVVSDDISDKSVYLSGRPELADFFNIDMSMKDNADHYGNVTFAVKKLKRRRSKENIKIIREIMLENKTVFLPGYVFIALGDDDLNAIAAEACRTAFDSCGHEGTISYVCEKHHPSRKMEPDMIPVFVNEKVQDSPLFSEIDRMAFNTHLVWEKSLNVDYKEIRAVFKRPYYHDSCVSSVLSLKYKLYSIGIDMESMGFSEAANQVFRIISDSENRTVKNELIWIEHRRWVTEKLCQGWRRLRDLNTCTSGVTKDQKTKRHVCIAMSRPDQRLADCSEGDRGFEIWDTASGDALNHLDDLDRMSVELHRVYSKKAKEVRKHHAFPISSLLEISNLINESREAVIAFQEWFNCIKEIWNEDTGKVPLYQGLRTAFTYAAESLPADIVTSIREHLEAFETLFYPVLASMEYRDWKQDDVALIDNIPFVLTYTEKAYLAIPFATGNNTDLFGNVAAAVDISPERIIYLYHLDSKANIAELQNALSYTVEYIVKKNMKASIDFVITYPESMALYMNDDLERTIRIMGKGRIRKIKFLSANDEEIPLKIGVYLRRRRRGKKFFAVEKNDTPLSRLLEKSGFYNSFASYRFDSGKRVFGLVSGCNMLGFINKESYILATDLADVHPADGKAVFQPEFFGDYRKLWSKYCEDKGAWKSLCRYLGEYENAHEVLVSFKNVDKDLKNPGGPSNVQEYRYIVPYHCRSSIAQIIQKLKDAGIAGQESCIRGNSTESCEVVLFDRFGFRAEYDRLFANVYALMIPDALKVRRNDQTESIDILYDDLMVKNVPIDAACYEKIRSLVEYFRELGYVIDPVFDPGNGLSFTYATRQIKELLVSDQIVLEVYVYHMIKESGAFDDVISSHAIEWSGKYPKNSFDYILTRGFRTLFVKCTLSENLKGDIKGEHYRDLADIRDSSGINAEAVLIVDEEVGRNHFHAPVTIKGEKHDNMLQRAVIVRDDHEIQNIGQTLLQIINGTYVKQEG